MQQTLNALVERFDNLSMRGPAKDTSGHPYEFIANSFPVYEDFHNYFIDLAPAYKNPELFGDFLFNVYQDLRNLPALINEMKNGTKPQNMEKTFESMRKFTELSRRKYTQANSWLAQEYKTKH